MNDDQLTCTPAVAAVKPMKPELADAPNLMLRLLESGNDLTLLHAVVADSEQLARMVEKINAATPDFKSIMGSECDHAELALAAMIEERDRLKAVAAAADAVIKEMQTVTLGGYWLIPQKHLLALQAALKDQNSA